MDFLIHDIGDIDIIISMCMSITIQINLGQIQVGKIFVYPNL